MDISDIFLQGANIESPESKMAEHNIALETAKIKAAADPLVLSLNVLGSYLMSSSSEMPDSQLKSLFGSKSIGTELSASLYNTTSDIGAFGGRMRGRVEVEGGEVFETPNGGIGRFRGPKHEQGGINTVLPDGTQIFSQRIMYKGETLADRKIKRESKLAKLLKKLEKNPDDKVLSETVRRVRENNRFLDRKDMQLQEKVKQQVMQAAINPDKRDSINQELTQNDIKFGFGGSVGDAIGLIGQFYSALAPLKNTLANRAGDTPNINFYKDYGEATLAEFEANKDDLESLRSRELSNLELSKNSAISRSRNKATSINTLRAFDILNQQNANIAAGKINNQIDSKVATIGNQKAQALLGIDAKRRAGAEKADLLNRQDRDAFYTQLGRDKVNLGFGIQNIGKSLNTMKTRNQNLDLINKNSDIFEYDVWTGKIKVKPDADFSKVNYTDLYEYTRTYEPQFFEAIGMSETTFNKLPKEEQAKLLQAYYEGLKNR